MCSEYLSKGTKDEDLHSFLMLIKAYMFIQLDELLLYCLSFLVCVAVHVHKN